MTSKIRAYFDYYSQYLLTALQKSYILIYEIRTCLYVLYENATWKLPCLNTS